MLRLLHFLQNFTAVFILFLLVAISTVATMTLSPVALDDTGNVAGVDTTTGQILSNYKPLKFEDQNVSNETYDTQLVEITPISLNYSFNIAPLNEGLQTKPFLKVTNNNSVALNITLSGKLPEQVQDYLALLVSDNVQRRVVTDADGLVINIEPNSTKELELVLDVKKATNFPVSGSIEITTPAN